MPIHTELLIALMIPLTYGVLVGIEHFGTGQEWPKVRGWQMTCLQLFIVQGIINGLISGQLRRLLPGVHVVNGSQWGVVTGTLMGYMILSFGNAVLHRGYHRHGWLWRHVHQMHHAPPRLDVAGVMYQSPVEMLANALLFVSVTTFLLGLDPVSSMLCAYVGAFYGMYQHFNIRTPQWLGYLIQRPEAHCLHHERDVHAWNYSDLPIWDILWGTFRNPREFPQSELGFDPAAARQVWAMLAGRDVNVSTLGPNARGRSVSSTNPA